MRAIDLRSAPSAGHSLLVYGMYGFGKTFFGGDALATERANGDCFFASIGEQDGWAPLQGMDLTGVQGVHLGDYDDCMTFCKARKPKPRLIVYDGLEDIATIAMCKAIGTDTRLPKVSKDDNEWGKVHFAMKRLIDKMKAAAAFTIFTCPARRYEIPDTGVWWITPKLPGRQSTDAIGWFNFVAYLRAVNKRTSVNRTLIIAPQAEGDKNDPSILTRQRMTREIREDIALPDGPGGWQVWLDVVRAHEGSADGAAAVSA